MSTNLHDRAIRHDDVVVADEVYDGDGVGRLARLVALAAGVVVAVIGLMACLEVDWGAAHIDAPLVDVSGMTFTPIVAVVTAVLGLLLVGVAAARDPEGRVVLGAVLASIGAAVLLVGDLGTRWQVGDRQGWLALGVGAVFVVAGLLGERRELVRTRRTVRRQELR